MTQALPCRIDKCLILVVLATACLLFSTVPANAATYYVATDGDDDNLGTIEEPWATVEYGLLQLDAGDVLYLREGTYKGRYSTNPLPNDGTAENPITVASYPGEQAVLTIHPDGSKSAVWWMNNSYFILDGLEFDGTVDGVHYGLAIDSSIHHITVRNCVFHDFYSNYIKFHGVLGLNPDSHTVIEYCEFYESPNRPQTSVGAFIDACGHNYIEIHHNYFHDAHHDGTEGILLKGGTKHCSVHHNLFERISVEGTYAGWASCAIEVGGSTEYQYWIGDWECEDTIVYNNLIVNGSASAILFWGAKDCSAYNNTIVNVQGNSGITLHSSFTSAGLVCNSENITIKNNIIVYGGDWGNFRIYPGQETGFISDNNLFWRIDGQPPQFKWNGSYVDFDTYRGLSGQDANSTVADPLLMGDYHLTANSPAIDAGVYELGVPSDDFDGNFRPYGDAIDIGAYEYVGAGGGNQAPVLSWAGESGYQSDGLDPETGTATTDFTWKIKYSDADADAPYGVYLHILDDGTEVDNSPYEMTAEGSGDWSAGVIFAKTLTLPKGTDYTYYFSAADEHGAQTSYPASPVSGPQVDNSPPTAPTVTISPQSPTDEEELQATVEGSTDIDQGDEISYEYQWYCDDVLEGDSTTATLPAARTSGGEVWRCEVIATDGEDDSEAGTAQVTIIATYSISGTVIDADDNLVADVNVSAGDASATTDSEGKYIISSLLAGIYEVTPSSTDWVFSPESQTVTVDAGNGSQSGIDFTGYPPPPPPEAYTISGTVLDSGGQPLPGVTVSAGEFSGTTDSEGTYSITGLAKGTYTVSPSKDEYTFEPESQPVTVGPDKSGINFTATVITYAISGTVTDSASQALSGVTVAAGSQSATTDSQGQYSITGLVAGTYTVAPSKDEYAFDPENRSVTVGPDKSGIDFTGTPITHSVSGSVSDASGLPLAGVTVSAGDQSGTTDAGGAYTITGLVAGTYTVTPSKDEYTFEPESRSVTVGPDQSGIDFAALQVRDLSEPLPAKWSLVSIPLQPAVFTASKVLEELWPLVWEWHNTADDPPARYIAKPPSIHMGRSVFAYVEQAGVALDLVGAEFTGEVHVDLNTGWNFIGGAFPTTVPYSSLELERSGTRVSLMQAVENDWIWPITFTWNSDKQEYEAWLMDSGGLEPWGGGVVYCQKPCTLIQPPPSASPDQLAGQVQPSRVGNEDDVLFQIRAETTGSSDVVTAALVEGATADFDGVLLDVPKAPPPPGGRVRVCFLNQYNTGNPGPRQWQRETRGPTDLTSDTPWRLMVLAPPNQEVTLSWPDLSRLPHEVRPILHDIATGGSLYMRTQLRYRFTTDDSPAPRLLELRLAKRQGQSLMLHSVSAAASRGSGAIITFALSTDAEVRAEISNIAGRRIRTVLSDKLLSDGLHTLSWNGYDNRGTPVPSGLYIVRLRAHQPDGRQAQALTTCSICR